MPIKFCVFFFFIFMMACTAPKEKIPPMPGEARTDKAIIYQMMTRLFGNTKTAQVPYGTLVENGVGKFKDISPIALKSLKDMGITHVWYTGVIEHATTTDYSQFGIAQDDGDVVKGRAGSPYAIKDYYDVDPDLAVNVPERMKEFEQLVERTHAQGLKVLIDFVPNHVARSYRSDAKPSGVRDLGEGDDTTKAFSPRNNFYYLPGQDFVVPNGHHPLGPQGDKSVNGKFRESPAKATGNDRFTHAPSSGDWFETVKLNYGIDMLDSGKTYFDPIPDTWIQMRDILLFWAGKHVDGFRCDMAEMVPVPFWNWAISQVKVKYPNVTFIAEIYNPALYRDYLKQGQFDFLYDKVELYDTLKQLVKGKGSAEVIHTIQQRHKDFRGNFLHFMENHDEERVASPSFAGNPWKALPAMVVSATIDHGAMMVYFGQEVGEPGSGAEGYGREDGRTTIFDYWGVPEHQKWVNGGKYDGGMLSMEQKQLRIFYSDLLNMASSNKALSQGDYYDVTTFNIQKGNFKKNIHAFVRAKDDERLLIVTNFSAEAQSIQVSLPEEVALGIGLEKAGVYIARDMLWKEMELGMGSGFTLGFLAKPYSSFIFKIK